MASPADIARRLCRVFIICLAALGVCSTTAQTTLTFDSLQPGNEWVAIQNGYGDLLWNNFGALNGFNHGVSSGYRTGVVSSNNVAFNLYGEPMTIHRNGLFILNSAYLTSQVVTGLQVRVQGFVGASAVFDTTYVLNTTGPTFANFNSAPIDTVKFTAIPESWFAMDNLTVSLVSTSSCTFDISPADQVHYSGVETGTVSVTTSAGCSWAVSNTNPWITILSELNNTNSGTVVYQVSANSTGLPRHGFINIAGRNMSVGQYPYQQPGTNIVNLGNVQVSTIGHSFFRPIYPPGPLIPSSVIDYLIDQDHGSGGGGSLSPVSVNWDTNHQFVLTVAAPPGKKFLIQVPVGKAARFGGSLQWESAGRGGLSPVGPVTVTFTGFEGTPPDFSGSDAMLSDQHGYFGFWDIDSAAFNTDLAFTSMTLTGIAAQQYTGLGTLDFAPHHECKLVVSYLVSQTNDPSGFVTIVDLPTALMTTVNPLTTSITRQANGDLTITFVGTLQSASNPSGPFQDVAGSPNGAYTIPKANQAGRLFFRTRSE